MNVLEKIVEEIESMKNALINAKVLAVTWKMVYAIVMMA
mgnify:CR=1 FL=1